MDILGNEYDDYVNLWADSSKWDVNLMQGRNLTEYMIAIVYALAERRYITGESSEYNLDELIFRILNFKDDYKFVYFINDINEICNIDGSGYYCRFALSDEIINKNGYNTTIPTQIFEDYHYTGFDEDYYNDNIKPVYNYYLSDHFTDYPLDSSITRPISEILRQLYMRINAMYRVINKTNSDYYFIFGECTKTRSYQPVSPSDPPKDDKITVMTGRSIHRSHMYNGYSVPYFYKDYMSDINAHLSDSLVDKLLKYYKPNGDIAYYNSKYNQSLWRWIDTIYPYKEKKIIEYTKDVYIDKDSRYSFDCLNEFKNFMPHYTSVREEYYFTLSTTMETMLVIKGYINTVYDFSEGLNFFSRNPAL